MSVVMVELATGRRYVEKYVTFIPANDGTMIVSMWDKLTDYVRSNNGHKIMIEVPRSLWEAPNTSTKVEPIKFDTSCEFSSCRYKGVPHFHQQGEGGVVVENQMIPSKS